MSLSLRCSVEQTLTKQQRLELRLEQVQTVALRLSAFFKEVDPPETFIAEAVAEALACLGNPAQLSGLADDAALHAAIADESRKLCMPDDAALYQLAASYAFRLQTGESVRGTFSYDAEEGGHRSDEVRFQDFLKALAEPDAQRAELDRLTGLLELQQKDYGGLLEDRRWIEGAVTAADQLREPVAALAQMLRILFAARRPDAAVPVLVLACRRIEAVRAFAPTFSSRFLARFVERFRHCGGRTELLKTSFLNTIGEYVLLGMGVLSPTIFQLYRWKMSPESVAELEKLAQRLGTTLDGLLSAAGRTQYLYCNRWALAGKRHDARTDDAVLRFITGMVRRERDRIFACFSFENFLEELQGTKDPTERTEALVAVLTDAAFEETLLACATETWYPALQEFLR